MTRDWGVFVTLNRRSRQRRSQTGGFRRARGAKQGGSREVGTLCLIVRVSSRSRLAVFAGGCRMGSKVSSARVEGLLRVSPPARRGSRGMAPDDDPSRVHARVHLCFRTNRIVSFRTFPVTMSLKHAMTDRRRALCPPSLVASLARSVCTTRLASLKSRRA